MLGRIMQHHDEVAEGARRRPLSLRARANSLAHAPYQGDQEIKLRRINAACQYIAEIKFHNRRGG